MRSSEIMLRWYLYLFLSSLSVKDIKDGPGSPGWSFIPLFMGDRSPFLWVTIFRICWWLAEGATSLNTSWWSSGLITSQYLWTNHITILSSHQGNMWLIPRVSLFMDFDVCWCLSVCLSVCVLGLYVVFTLCCFLWVQDHSKLIEDTVSVNIEGRPSVVKDKKVLGDDLQLWGIRRF